MQKLPAFMVLYIRQKVASPLIEVLANPTSLMLHLLWSMVGFWVHVALIISYRIIHDVSAMNLAYYFFGN